jgi:hypothetical protein
VHATGRVGTIKAFEVVMFRIEWSGDKLPGERGRKVEHFMARPPRYRFIAAVGMFTATMLALNGWLARGDPIRRPGLWWTWSAILCMLSVTTWLVGSRSARLRDSTSRRLTD